MDADEDGEPKDSMATFETYEDAQRFCFDDTLLSASRGIIIDADTADGIFSK